MYFLALKLLIQLASINPLTDKAVMSSVVLLLCTTIISNTGNASIVTRDCRPQEAASLETHETVLAKPVTEIPAENVTDVARQPSALPPAIEPPAELPKAVAALPKPSVPEVAPSEARPPETPVKAKPARAAETHVKPRRTRLASHTPRRHHVRRTRQTDAIQVASEASPPVKKATLWDKLKKLPWKSPFSQ